MSNDIGIDLGTASILVYIKGKGVVLKEPSVVAIDRDTNKIMGHWRRSASDGSEELRATLWRVRPLRQGVTSDYTVTEKMLKYFINKAVGEKTPRNRESASASQAVPPRWRERPLKMRLCRREPERFPLLKSL